jgi:hypothetical protein
MDWMFGYIKLVGIVCLLAIGVYSMAFVILVFGTAMM